MDISKMSLVELKAMAYDILANIEGLNKDLQTINKQISIKSNEEKQEKTD